MFSIVAVILIIMIQNKVYKQMPLILSSPALSKDHKKFLSKLQRYYHKRGSSFYMPSKKRQSGSFTTKISSIAIEKIKVLMQDFMDKISQLIKQFTVLDHYSFLQIVRKNSFFRDINDLIDKNLHTKIQTLEKQLINKEQKIIFLKNQDKKECNNNIITHQQETLEKIQCFENKNYIKYNSSLSLATNLYCHARALNQEDFLDFYHKISLTHPITFKKVQGQQNETKNSISMTAIDTMIIDKLNELVKYTKRHNNEKQAEAIKLLLNEYISNKKCKNPCCCYKEQEIDTRVNKAKALMSTALIKFSKNIYRDNQSQSYLLRRCKDSHLNMKDVSKVRVPDIDKIGNEFNQNFSLEQSQNENHKFSLSMLQ